MLQRCQWLLWCRLCEERVDGCYQMAIEVGGSGHDGGEVMGRGAVDTRYCGLEGGGEGCGGPCEARELGVEAEEGY